MLYAVLVAISLLLVHGASYEPPVSFVPLYLAASVGIVSSAIVVPLLPTRQFTTGFCGGVYAAYAAIAAMLVFFSGGVSSELYLLFFPLLLASALHGSWSVVLGVLASALFFYGLASMPGLLEAGTGEDVAATVFYRLGTLMFTGLFLAYASREIPGAEGAEDAPQEGSTALVEQVEGEISSRKGVPVAAILVDPGDAVRDLDLLLDRVDARIGEPVMLDEGNLFGLVVSGVDDNGAESAARRALAAASSLGARETRAGAAIYPRDARSAEDLLMAAGRALEASFEIEGPSAIVMAGRNAPEGYREAR